MSNITDIFGWHTNFAVVTQAVAYIILGSFGYKGKHVKFKQLIKPYNLLAGANGAEDIGKYNEAMITRSFCNSSNEKYFAS